MMLLLSRPPSPRIPLCVLYVADGSSHQLSTAIEGLRLDSLLSDGLLSDYRVYALSSSVTSHTSLSNVCAFLYTYYLLNLLSYIHTAGIVCLNCLSHSYDVS